MENFSFLIKEGLIFSPWSYKCIACQNILRRKPHISLLSMGRSVVPVEVMVLSIRLTFASKQLILMIYHVEVLEEKET